MDITDVLKFDSNGLIPIVVQDFYNRDVLMLAYGNRESMKKTVETGFAHYYSRSRKKLWKKGETSGHVQRVKQILFDCDEDTVLFRVEQVGAACHTNHRSCFFREYYRGIVREVLPIMGDNDVVYETDIGESVIDKLYRILLDRKKDMPEGSYTAKLFRGGVNSVIKKIGEESAELVASLKGGDDSGIIYEAADLIFHIIVALAMFDIPPLAVVRELERRMGISGEFEKSTR